MDQTAIDQKYKRMIISGEQRRKLRDALDKNFTKLELDAGLKRIAQTFIINNMAFLERATKVEDLRLAMKKALNKNETIELCSTVFASKEVFQKFRESLPLGTQTVLDAIVWKGILHQTEINTQFGIDITTTKAEDTIKYTYYNKPKAVIKKEFKFFKIVDHDGWYTRKVEGNFSLSLPFGLRMVMIDFYDKPECAIIKPIEKPEKCDHSYATGEIDISLELRRFLLYINQGEIKLTAKGRPALTTFAKAQRKLNIKEFFPAKSDKGLRNVRTSLLLGMLATSNLSDASITEDAVRDIFSLYYPKRYESGASILYFIKGMTSISGYDLFVLEPGMLKLLDMLPVGEWVDFNRVKDYVTYNLIPLSVINKHYASEKLQYNYKEESKEGGYSYMKDRHFIDSTRYAEGIQQPYLKGTFFLYAAFGLVDIRYDQPSAKTLGKTYHSPYDGLRYVRLTNLGAYVLKKERTYTLPESGLKSSLILSPDNLMIVAKEEDETARALLSPFTEQVGPNRYHTDYNIFLNDCKSKNELDSKITLFKQTLGKELPPNWVNFLKELVQKINPFEPIDNITVFRIPEDNKQLIQIIARDEALRKLIIKAEGFHILVKKGNFSKFKKRLQDFGYLLT